MNKRLAYGLTAAALLAGCASIDTFGTEGGATLLVQPSVNSGRLVQSVSETRPYDASSVDRVEIALYRVGTPDTLVASRSVTVLGAPVQFVKLHHQTTYRILAKAFTAGNLKISDDSSSSVQLAIAYEDRPTLAKIPVVLVDRAFNGQTSAPIALATGSLTTSDPASMSVIALD